MLVDISDNTQGTNRGLNITPTAWIITNTVGYVDPNNYCHFRLSSSSSSPLALSNANTHSPISQIVEQVVQSAHNSLKALATDEDLTAKLNLAFSQSRDLQMTGTLVQNWAMGDFSALPSLDILDSSAINNANGAFSSATDVIYLSSKFITRNAANTQAITDVLLEEIGHYVDWQVNKKDTPGDEGAIFAALAQGKKLSKLEVLQMKAEDDTASATVGGQVISIEMSRPSLAVFDNSLYQSVQGFDNRIYTRSSTDGANWSGWDEDSGLTPSAPSMSMFNNSLYQSVQGFDNRIYTRSSTDGANWSGWDEDSGLTPSAPSMSMFNNSLYQSVQGFDNRIYTRSSTDGANWSGWGEDSGLTPSTPSMSMFNNSLYQSVQGFDNRIYTRSSTDGANWSGWDEDSGLTPSTPSMSMFNNSLYQSVQGFDNRIYTRSSTDGANWSGWDEDSGLTPSAPSMSMFNNSLYQSVQGFDNRIYTRSSTDGANWSGWSMSDNPPDDNTLFRARNIVVGSTSSTFSDFVGKPDTDDFYRFSLNTTSDLSVSLHGLSADADVEVIQDFNNNGVFEDDEIIDSSDNEGITAESLGITLLAGTYYINVYQIDGNTNYNLTLSAPPSAPLPPNNEQNIGTISGTRTFSNSVGSNEPNDFYRFNLTTNSNFGLLLNGLSSDADVDLVYDSNNNGVPEDDEFITSSNNEGITAESFSIALLPGTYYVNVYQFDGDTNYNLTLSATSV